jgi:hypothetical protein
MGARDETPAKRLRHPLKYRPPAPPRAPGERGSGRAGEPPRRAGPVRLATRERNQEAKRECQKFTHF